MRAYPLRFCCAVLPALFVPLVGALFYFVICDDPRTARIIYSGTKGFLVVWPVFAVKILVPGRPGAWRPRGSPPLRAVWAGVLSGVAISAFIALVMLSPLGRLVEASSGSIRERSVHLGILANYWAFSVFLSLVHSLLEEYYWRWFLYGRLQQIVKPLPAAILSSLGFGAHHVVITGQLMNWPLGVLCGTGIALGGVIWSLQFNHHRTLLAPWVSHAIVDFTVMAIGYRVLTMG